MIERCRLEQLLEGVEGWLPLEDAWYLCECATRASAAIVEIGAYRGRSTISLGHGAAQSQARPTVYSIEPHAEFTGIFGGRFGPQDREAYFRNLLNADLVKSVALVNLASRAAAAGWGCPIDLLFIDGDHRYEAVSEDVRLWVPHVARNGIIVFDDTFIPDSGPLRVFHELTDSGRYEEVEAAGKLRSLRKL